MNIQTQSVGSVKAAASVIGDKWTPQLLRFFVNEQTVRFCQLQELVGNINPRTLSARLLHLEEQGIIERHPTSTEKRCEYTLTKKGEDLIPVLKGMQRWSKIYG